ncbi:MAG: right-handed parallel beta-helix repeat-containing protein [Planctomycetota bacterium]|nr:right-handed parallel beta-helix repeat-containing protein [Planctomycetota bacterium]
MRPWPLAFVLLAASCGSSRSDDRRARDLGGIELVPGHALVVTEARPDLPLRVKSGTYVIPPLGDDGNRGVVILEGLRGATLDLDGVELRGTPAGTDLDRDTGHGIVLRDCRDVTIRGGKLGGYKVCVVATGCERLVFEDMTFDGWYGQRLLSTALAEDQSDWLYPHKNDEREWMTNHGAAIALEDCRDVTIRRARGRHGQNGILLTRCEGTRVYDCDFSFLSGWGIALYRANRSLVSRNRFDHCVRGYSHGVYWRGQDSAGILMFERCSDNVFVENSATHGGDGVFLFGGRDTVEGLAAARGESGAGSSDRNVWWRNDFSYAVANAIEATFSSDNWAIGNLLDGSHMHGVWGGYSRRMVVLDNSIRDTRGGGVSIEHGQECAIVGNELSGNDMAVELWWDEDPDLVGGAFGQAHDTASRDHLVLGNRFLDNAQDLVLRATQGVWFGPNDVGRGSRSLAVQRSSVVVDPGAKPIEVSPFFAALGELPSGVVADSTVRKFEGPEPEWLRRARAWVPPETPGNQRPFARDRGGRAGLDTIVMGEWGPWDFESGEPRPAQRQPGGLLAGSRWDSVWFRWEPVRDGLRGSGSDPREDLERWRALAAKPLARREVSIWTNPWAGDDALRRDVGNAHFGVVATARVAVLEGGRHRLSVVSDDGVRVRVDGRTVLENWTWHAPTRDAVEIDLAADEHTFVLEYFQIDGAAALSIELERL